MNEKVFEKEMTLNGINGTQSTYSNSRFHVPIV